MPILRSHTHKQAAQALTQAKACKRVHIYNRTRTLQTRLDSTSTERRIACNAFLKKVMVQCTADIFVVIQTLVHRINNSGENRHVHQIPKT